MDWFKNMSTGGKLLVGFGTMIVLLGITIAVAYSGITSIRDTQRSLLEREFAGLGGGLSAGAIAQR